MDRLRWLRAEGPQSSDDLARLVGARFWDLDQFERAMQAAISRGRVVQHNDGRYGVVSSVRFTPVCDGGPSPSYLGLQGHKGVGGSVRHEIVLRRAQVAVGCQCPCREPGRTPHDGCLEEIPTGGLLIEHIDEHGNTSRRCEVCGAVSDDPV